MTEKFNQRKAERAYRQAPVAARAVEIDAGTGSDFVMALTDTHSIATGEGNDFISISPMARAPGLQLFVPQSNGIWQNEFQLRRQA